LSSNRREGALASAPSAAMATTCSSAAAAITSPARAAFSPLVASRSGTAAASPGNAAGTTNQGQEEATVNIRMTIVDDDVLTATLTDNATTRDFLLLRSQRARMNWDRMQKLLDRYPLPRPRIMHPRAANP
jgi:hypothetical protein